MLQSLKHLKHTVWRSKPKTGGKLNRTTIELCKPAALEHNESDSWAETWNKENIVWFTITGNNNFENLANWWITDSRVCLLLV